MHRPNVFGLGMIGLVYASRYLAVGFEFSRFTEFVVLMMAGLILLAADRFFALYAVVGFCVSVVWILSWGFVTLGLFGEYYRDLQTLFDIGWDALFSSLVGLHVLALWGFFLTSGLLVISHIIRLFCFPPLGFPPFPPIQKR